MKKFKQISHNPEPEVIGVNNGVYQLEIEIANDIDGIADKLYTSLNNEAVEKIITSDIKFIGKLVKNAKITDFMVFSPYIFGINYMISQKVVDIFNEVGVSNDEYLLKEIKIIGIDTKYYLLYIPMISSEEIDFSNSILYEDGIIKAKKYLKVNSYIEYRNALEKNPFIDFEKICLNKKYEKRHIISVRGAVKPFFSTQLINVLNRHNITGFVVLNHGIELVFDCE